MVHVSSALAYRRLKGGCGGNHHPCTFQVLKGGTHLFNSSWNVKLSSICYFPWWRQLQWLPFSLSNHNIPHSTGQETNGGLYQMSKCIYPNDTFWIWGKNYRVYCWLYFSPNSINHLTFHVNSESVSNRPGNSDCFLSPSIQLPW